MEKEVAIKTLQRFKEKCISFMICVSAAKLFTQVMAGAISQGGWKSRRMITIEGALKEDIAYWSFIDDFDKWIPWRAGISFTNYHILILQVFWLEACMRQKRIWEYWPPDDDRPIRLKGADALFPSFCAFSNKIENSMVDTFV